MAFQYIKGAYKKDGDKLFSRACCDRTRGNGFSLKEGRFSLDMMKFFILRVVKHWKRFPGEVADAPSLETFRVRLVGAVSNLIWLKMALLIAGGWTFRGPFQPKLFYDFMTAVSYHVCLKLCVPLSTHKSWIPDALHTCTDVVRNKK